jgi:hypothetical protein
MKTLTKIILGIVTIVGVASSPLRAQEPDSRPNVSISDIGESLWFAQSEKQFS